MSAEANKKLIRDFLDSWNQRDMDAMARNWSPDMVHHTRNGAYGPAEVYSLMAGFMEAFPDLEFQIDDMVAEGDLVATRMTARATQKREFMGLPATGRQIACTVRPRCA